MVESIKPLLVCDTSDATANVQVTDFNYNFITIPQLFAIPSDVNKNSVPVATGNNKHCFQKLKIK